MATTQTLYDRQILDFERPIIELERKIDELRQLSRGSVDFAEEIRRLEKKARKLQEEIFAELAPWQKVQLSRHPARPYTLDYIGLLLEDFVELRGDRAFADDESIVGGLARFDGREVMVIGHQKGRNTKENLRRNFGMSRPEGYRKAGRLMQLAARFGRPILTFIDTPGAYPGLGAEERGQSEALARNILEMAHLPVPIVTLVIIVTNASVSLLFIGMSSVASLANLSSKDVIAWPTAALAIMGVELGLALIAIALPFALRRAGHGLFART